MDLPAYLRRLGLVAPPGADEAGLAALHEAHRLAIPFENLAIHAGQPIRLELEAIEAKLVAARRGGYCFEQNRLFAAALQACGFGEATSHHARVRLSGGQDGPRTHKVLSVVVGGRRWLCDVGFGAGSLLRPMPLEPGEVTQHGWRYRLTREGTSWVLGSWSAGGWVDDYAFPDEPSLPIDDEVANHYTSTHPASRFVTTLTVQRAGRDVRQILRGRNLETIRHDGRDTRVLAEEEIVGVLREVFGLEPPAGLRLPA